jgi:hypothetical protein
MFNKLAQNEYVKMCPTNKILDKKLQICKMSKLNICVITNICNQIYVTFGRTKLKSIQS